ncbi:UDP-N-acetylmuramate dehydrogenase [Patescibacteria group bacterium]|nr:UDP-N-acetylmuramate dehydrogenase [Patescibacteria group bacterium]
MDYSSLAKLLQEKIKNLTVHLDHPLALYTTLKIGGPADLLIESKNPEQFISIIKLLHQQKQPQPTILGHGSNVLISDTGIRGLVIQNSGDDIGINNSKVTLSSGTSLPHAIDFTLNKNLVGLEVFAYIPATIGGAVHSNIHGFDKSNFSQFIDSIEVFNYHTGKTETLKSSDFNWSYDLSPFQDNFKNPATAGPHLIITSVTLSLKKGDGQLAKTKAEEIKAIKKQTQPFLSAGCTFKNLPAEAGPNQSAGLLIDQLGLKGHRQGNLQISPLHANFIVNTRPATAGAATASDYIKLTEFIRQKVKDKYNINLEFEIKLLGKF